jgi:putative endonuclease
MNLTDSVTKSLRSARLWCDRRPYRGPMTVARQRLGRRAEGLVTEALVREGARIVGTNVRPTGVRGEIDLIVMEGSTLVFVEVKARTAGATRGPNTPLLAVDRRKQLRLRRLAAAWLRELGDEAPRRRSIRFDVVGLTLDGAGSVVGWEHVRGAF